MNNSYQQRLAGIQACDVAILEQRGMVGLEKEGLRVAADNTMAKTPHPKAFGSPLTNPIITTDFSEALLELITPPFSSVTEAHSYLENIHRFVCQNLDNELLWNSSMPCVLRGEEKIPLARYGSSNAAQMKTVYRRGLGYRYGRTMQVIAGIHFNYSFSDTFWQHYQQIVNDEQSLQTFISEEYFGVLRNLQRVGWFIPYLFGASPAVCRSFLHGKQTSLELYDDTTYFEPWATSLRMGDIGYQNNKENEIGVKACYDNLEEYLETLIYAIDTPYPGYERIGVKVDGIYRQLNANILQIENEYYSTVRPKQPIRTNESSALALIRRGVRYVELRSLDINPFANVGIELYQLYFLEAFYFYCLLQPSPRISPWERAEIDKNEMIVAHTGRKPGLRLLRNGEEVTLRCWGEQICDEMAPVCQMLDAQHIGGGTPYSDALAMCRRGVDDPENTLSARVLREMGCRSEGYNQFANRRSRWAQNEHQKSQIPEQTAQQIRAIVEKSNADRKKIEAEDTMSFDDYLTAYFARSMDGFQEGLDD